jgi:hypothetical protein
VFSRPDAEAYQKHKLDELSGVISHPKAVVDHPQIVGSSLRDAN